jgi:tripartite-type tricarboxylate transporter receptor subunit TctC
MARAAIASALLAALAAGICGFDTAQGQTYPTRPVTIVVPGAAGGGGDFTARLVGEQISRALGQQFVIENKPGANGNLAALTVARAAPDGYTLLLAYSGSHVANPALFKNNQWDPIKSFTPVALAIKAPHAMVAKKDLPAANLREFIAYAKQNPGKINFGSAGPGSIQHIGGEQLARLIDTKMVHVAYRGGALAMNDLLAGSIELLITTPPPVVGHLRGGSVKGLAIASKVRHPMLPDLPTTAEAGLPGFELDAWFGFYAPAGTPQPIVDRLAAEIEKIVKSDDFKRRAEESGTYAVYMSPMELAAFTRTELVYWSDMIKQLGITLD